MSLSFRITDSDSGTEFSGPMSGQAHMPASSTALNFLAAIISTKLDVYSPSDLSLAHLHHEPPKFAGIGGHAAVQVGQTNSGRSVAVKRSRVSGGVDGGDSSRDRQFAQMVLEMRILTNKHLRFHPHIVDILGLCIESPANAASFLSFSIVLEYSQLGNLSTFLRKREPNLAIEDRLDLASQVGQGLDALHRLGICHGDVKLQNILVFPCEDGSFVAKISDFGISVIAVIDHPEAKLQCSYGTCLLNAPEIRNSPVATIEFDIHAAIRTDVFSFGLLVWEVINNGRPYFDEKWMGRKTETRQEIDDTEKEDFLRSLPCNSLIDYAQTFLSELKLDPELHRRVCQLFDACLQDEPLDRKQMSSIIHVEMMQTNGNSTIMGGNLPNEPDLDHDQVPKTDGFLASWTSKYSLFEILDIKSARHKIRRYPFTLQQSVLKDLKALATSAANSAEIRGHSAMTLSECYAIAFGTTYDSAEILRWLDTACLEGFPTAIQWIQRVREAVGASTAGAVPVADCDLSVNELYLTTRIWDRNTRLVSNIAEIMSEAGLLHPEKLSKLAPLRFSFDYLVSDDLLPLHAAALLGQDELVAKLLCNSDASEVSSSGFNVAHFACLGGHFSTLRYVLEQGVDVTSPSLHNITPLHLSIFFHSGDIQDAVDLLISHHVNPETISDKIQFRAHDLLLEGTPLDWAVITRNRTLVHALLPHCKQHFGIHFALHLYYYEIASDLLSHRSMPQSLPQALPLGYKVRSLVIRRPFLHWIAHGPYGLLAIKRTLHLCARYDLIDHYQALRKTISSTRSQADLEVLETLLSLCPSSAIRQGGKLPWSALTISISASKNNPGWARVLELIVNHYSVAELNGYTYKGTMNCLHVAISEGSVTAARVLLEKGVDPNARTRHLPPLAPLQLCNLRLSPASRNAMWATLLEYGAEVDALVLDRSLVIADDNLLSLLLQHTTPTTADGSTLLVPVLQRLFELARSHLPQFLQSFRMALSQEQAAKYINLADQHGLTMLHRAAGLMLPKLLKLLLDAGADATVPFMTADESGGPSRPFALLPLQILCRVGRYMPTDHEVNHTKEPAEIAALRAEILETAMDLVRWHQARGDGLFDGITKLHLAFRFSMPNEAQKLRDDGYDLSAKGSWPGVVGRLTPKEFLHVDFEDETDAACRCLRIIGATGLRPGDLGD